MSIGAAAGGAADALAKVIAQRHEQQQLEALIASRDAALAESQRSSQADEAYRTRSLDIQQAEAQQRAEERATTAREKANVRGVQRMAGEFITQHQGPYTPEDVRGVNALQIEMGQVPKIEIPQEPEKKYTSPLKIKGGTYQQFEEGKIPPGTRFYEEPKDIDVTNLTPEGLQAAAMNYARTGQMPALGMGDKNTRKAIINAAAAYMPNLDIAGNRADFAANNSALTQLTKTREAVGAFEQTALRNIDIFLDTAKKVADTGSPLLNQPARYVTGQMLGSPNVSDFNSARQIVINEVAKVTTNPNLTGQLSDTARKEVEAFNPANATLAQLISVSKILKRDMANRTDALDDQIAGIRTRIRSGGPTPVPGAAGGGGGDLIEAIDPQGNVHHAPAGTPLPAGWKLKG